MLLRKSTGFHDKNTRFTQKTQDYKYVTDLSEFKKIGVVPRADPQVRLGGGAISVIFGSQVSHNSFGTVREMKHTSQHCCDKIMDKKWLYIANVVFQIVQNQCIKLFS